MTSFARVLGALLFLSSLGACPKPAGDASTDGQRDEPIAKPGDERRLSVKIAALTKLRDELETVRGELGDDAKRAESLNVLYLSLRNRFPPERADGIVAAVRTSRAADKPVAQAAGGPMTRLERLTRLQKTGAQLMVPEQANDDDGDMVAVLKKRLAAEQEATAPVLAAAKLGADALKHVEELKAVVGELATIAEAEGLPPKATSADPGR